MRLIIKLIKRLFAFLIAYSFVTILSVSIIAFDANDYDYGSGGSDWGSSYDSGSDWGSDYSDSGTHYSYDYEEETPVFFIFAGGGVVVSVILAVVFYFVEGAKLRRDYGPPKQVNKLDYKMHILPNRNVEIESIIKQRESNFNANDFNSFAETVWRRVQSAWCAKDLEPVRNLLGFNLYNTTQKQIQDKIDRHVSYHYENISFIETYLTSYVRDVEFEYLTVYTRVEYIDYQTDEITGKIIKGDTSTHWRIDYKMKFQRVVSLPEAEMICPNCGANIDITSSAKCPYCGTVITTSSREWVLCDFTSVRDDTTDDGIRID